MNINNEIKDFKLIITVKDNLDANILHDIFNHSGIRSASGINNDNAAKITKLLRENFKIDPYNKGFSQRLIQRINDPRLTI